MIKGMKIITFLTFFLLLLFSIEVSSCGTPKIGNTPATVEEAEAILAKQAKKKAKAAKKAKKEAYKRFWKMQSKEAKKSIKRNKRRQKKIEKAKRKSHY
ncbi:MAG: hypothetical protein ACK457_13260 [Flavobacteriia bacterium]|jgi:hypothetical protein